MKRTVRCLVLLALGAGAWACRGNPTSDLDRGTPTGLQADPSALFIDQGSSVGVIVEAKDALNQVVEMNSISATASAGVTVLRDSTYNRVYDANGNLVLPENPTRARFVVTAVSPVGTSITVNANGLSLTVPVRVIPVSLTAALSNTAPALGEDVTLTLPGQLEFDAAIVGDNTMWQGLVTFAGATDPLITDVQAQSVTFQVAPNTDAEAEAHHVVMPYATSAGELDLQTTEVVQSPVIAQMPVTVSNATPMGGEVVTITAGAGFSFDPAAEASVGPACPGSPPGCEPGMVDARAGNGSSISVAMPVNTTGGIFITGVVPSAAPTFVLDLPSSASVTVGPSPFVGTDAVATAPAITLPASGNTLVIYDGEPFLGAGRFGSLARFFRITVGAQTAFDMTQTWPVSVHADLGIYLRDGANATDVCVADGNGGQDGGPESASCDLAPGTYVVQSVTFDALVKLYRMEFVVQ